MADKYLFQNAGTLTEREAIVTSTGASDGGKIPATDGSGRLAASFMPVGIGADTAVIPASEALAAGDLVNVWNNAGTPSVRKADASASGKEAHGFVTAAFASAANATVFFEGTDTAVTGLTGGRQFLSATSAGKTVAAAPTGSGQVVQVVGFATAAAALNFNSGTPIVLA